MKNYKSIIPTEIKKNLEETVGLKVDSIGEASVTRSIRERMHKLGLTDDQSYLNYLRERPSEIQELIECVIVPETWFFRDHYPFVALVSYLKENWDRSYDLRILSLPCSTGEEPYSIAMALLMAGIDKELFTIDAVDVSRRSLDKAKVGIYSNNSFRADDLRFRDIFFNRYEKQYKIKDVIRKRVHFVWGNILHTPSTCFYDYYDVVFCRNVLIYFDKQVQKKVIVNIERILKPGGVLFTGHAEAALFIKPVFMSLRYKGAFGVKKTKGIDLDRLFQKNGKSFEKSRGKDLTGRRLPDQNKKKSSLVSGENHLLLLAEEMVQSGNVSHAESICNKLLEKEPTPMLFFLFGLIRESQGKVDEAIDMLRKAVYLDPHHHESLTFLALLAKRTGDETGARNYWRRATRSDRDKSK